MDKDKGLQELYDAMTIAYPDQVQVLGSYFHANKDVDIAVISPTAERWNFLLNEHLNGNHIIDVRRCKGCSDVIEKTRLDMDPSRNLLLFDRTLGDKSYMLEAADFFTEEVGYAPENMSFYCVEDQHVADDSLGRPITGSLQQLLNM